MVTIDSDSVYCRYLPEVMLVRTSSISGDAEFLPAATKHIYLYFV